jgi:hypothetical protein
VSDTQAAAYLLGMPAILISHEFSYCFIQNAMDRVRERNPQIQAPLPAIDETEEDDETMIPREIFNTGSGGATIYRISADNILPVTQDMNYMHRSDTLRSMTLYEYTAMVHVVKITSHSTAEPLDDGETTIMLEGVSRGRRPNATIPFTDAHPLHVTHVQKLRSKFAVPILTGRCPPSLPGLPCDTSEWKAKASTYAFYMLTLFSPWNASGLPIAGSTWEDFCTFKKILDEGTFAQRNTSVIIENISNSMHVDRDAKRLAVRHRNRSTDHWDDNFSPDVQWPGALGDGNTGMTPFNDSDSDHDNTVEVPQLDPSFTLPPQQMNVLLHADFINTFLLPSTNLQASLQNHVNNNNVDITLLHTPDEECKTMFAANKHRDIIEQTDPAVHEPQPEPVVTIGNIDVQNSEHAIEQTLLNSCNEKQRAVVNEVLDFIDAKIQWQNDPSHCAAPITPHIFVHGGPGVGKSFTIDTLTKIASFRKRKVLVAAYTGVAASNIDGGDTLHRVFKFSFNSMKGTDLILPLNDSLLKLLENNLLNVDVLVVDELSNLEASFISHIDERLRQALGNNLPFGGLAVIFMGDFFQNSPTQGNYIFVDVMKFYRGEIYEANKAIIAGINLFVKFKKFEFTQQMRAIGDPIHTARLNRFRSYVSKPVNSDDVEWVKSRVITPTESNSLHWVDCSIAVTCNYIRTCINIKQALKFALLTGVPVIRWRLPLPRSFAHWTADDRNLLYDQNPQLWQYFVTGARAMILSNINVNKKTSNGTECKYHSLKLPDNMTDDMFSAFKTNAALASPGELLTLPDGIVPFAINVELSHVDRDSWPSVQSIDEDKIVIPILESPSGTEFPLVFNNTALPSKVKVKMHAVDLAFSVTYDKIQGKTVSRLIADFNHVLHKPHVCMSNFVVGTSRVRNSSDIRFLPFNTDIRRNELPFIFLENLKVHESLIQWNTCFNNNGIFVPPPTQIQETSTYVTPNSQSRLTGNDLEILTGATNPFLTPTTLVDIQSQSHATTYSWGFVPFLCAVLNRPHPSIQILRSTVIGHHLWDGLVTDLRNFFISLQRNNPISYENYIAPHFVFNDVNYIPAEHQDALLHAQEVIGGVVANLTVGNVLGTALHAFKMTLMH